MAKKLVKARLIKSNHTPTFNEQLATAIERFNAEGLSVELITDVTLEASRPANTNYADSVVVAAVLVVGYESEAV